MSVAEDRTVAVPPSGVTSSGASRGLAGLVRRLCGGLRGWRDCWDHAFQELAATVQEAREPAAVWAALVRQAARVSGADRVELYDGEGPGRCGRLVAQWPAPSLPDGTAAGWLDGSHRVDARASAREVEGGRAIDLPLRAGSEARGHLRLVSLAPRRLPPRALRRVVLLATLAAAAERALGIGSVLDPPLARDPVTGLHRRETLAAILAHALAEGRRTEPLALLTLRIDGLPALQARLRPEITDATLQRVARAIVRSLRTSDIVARFEDDRFVCLLLGASAANARRAATTIRRAVAEAGVASPVRPPLTASIGIAGYPDHGQDAEVLLAASAAALARAQRGGPNQIWGGEWRVAGGGLKS